MGFFDKLLGGLFGDKNKKTATYAGHEVALKAATSNGISIVEITFGRGVNDEVSRALADALGETYRKVDHLPGEGTPQTVTVMYERDIGKVVEAIKALPAPYLSKTPASETPAQVKTLSATYGGHDVTLKHIVSNDIINIVAITFERGVENRVGEALKKALEEEHFSTVMHAPESEHGPQTVDIIGEKDVARVAEIINALPAPDISETPASQEAKVDADNTVKYGPYTATLKDRGSYIAISLTTASGETAEVDAFGKLYSALSEKGMSSNWSHIAVDVYGEKLSKVVEVIKALPAPDLSETPDAITAKYCGHTITLEATTIGTIDYTTINFKRGVEYEVAKALREALGHIYPPLNVSIRFETEQVPQAVWVAHRSVGTVKKAIDALPAPEIDTGNKPEPSTQIDSSELRGTLFSKLASGKNLSKIPDSVRKSMVQRAEAWIEQGVPLGQKDIESRLRGDGLTARQRKSAAHKIATFVTSEIDRRDQSAER